MSDNPPAAPDLAFTREELTDIVVPVLESARDLTRTSLWQAEDMEKALAAGIPIPGWPWSAQESDARITNLKTELRRNLARLSGMIDRAERCGGGTNPLAADETDILLSLLKPTYDNIMVALRDAEDVERVINEGGTITGWPPDQYRERIDTLLRELRDHRDIVAAVLTRAGRPVQ